MSERTELGSWYRSLKNGKLWCESSNPDEVARSGGEQFEKLTYFQVTDGWKP